MKYLLTENIGHDQFASSLSRNRHSQPSAISDRVHGRRAERAVAVSARNWEVGDGRVSGDRSGVGLENVIGDADCPGGCQRHSANCRRAFGVLPTAHLVAGESSAVLPVSG